MSSSHYYHPVTGGLIDGGLREARKVGGLPSPTTVLSLIKGEGLIRYYQRQAWEAAVTTPRPTDMTDEEHYAACLRWSDEHSKAAREKGGDFHNLIQRFHMSCIGQAYPPIIPGQFREQYDAYLHWYETYVDRSLAVEAVVIGQGYAGRLDHYAQLKDGRFAVLDVKTQDLKNHKSFNFYVPWGLQLGAYGGALQDIQPVDVLVSVAISSGQPPVVLEAKYWAKGVCHWHQLFLGLLAIWQEENKYWPKPIISLESIDSQSLTNN